MHTLKIALLLAFTGLAGCLDASAPADPVEIPVSDAGPGPTKVDGVTASSIFTKVCAETLPKFTKARTEIARMSFQQHPKTGTYFHRKLNLSIKLTSGTGGAVCSMVFASNDDPGTLALIMAISGGGNSVSIDPTSHISTAKLANGARLKFMPVPIPDKKFYVVNIKTKH